METQEQIQALNGKQGQETGMLLNGDFFTESQWASVVEEIRENLTQRRAEKMIQSACPALMTWTWEVHFSRFGGGQHVANKTNIEIVKL